MKKLHLILVSFIILVLTAGCGKINTKQSSQSPNTDKSKVATTINAESKTAQTETKTKDNETGAQIIAKSGTTVSSKDKEAVLNEVSQELDTMLQSINNLDDVSDEDLNS